MTDGPRKVRVELGSLSEATGSCQLEFGSTKVLCAVTGPAVPVRSTVFNEEGTLKVDVRFAPWTKGGGMDNNNREQNALERQLSSQVYDAILPSVHLAPYPKAFITVHVVVLQACGGELAAAITAASLALSDAQIEVKDLVCACTIVECGEDEVLVDPEAADVKDRETGSLVLAKLVATDKITQVVQSGSKTAAKLDTMITLADKGCNSLNDVLRQFLRTKMCT